MSNKFKPGDLVELLPLNREVRDPFVFNSGIRPGIQGTIIKYLGTESSKYGFVQDAWEVQFQGIKYACACDEKILKLIPGNKDIIEIGSWDQCPWSPYKEKVTYDF